MSKSRQELIELVSRVMDPTCSEQDADRWIREIQANVPYPRVSDLIFYPSSGDTTPEEVVDKALSHKLPLLR
jgi:hypothetical protein